MSQRQRDLTTIARGIIHEAVEDWISYEGWESVPELSGYDYETLVAILEKLTPQRNNNTQISAYDRRSVIADKWAKRYGDNRP